jgi:hypothetical protein
MVKQVKGPLTLGDEAKDIDYNQQMKDLMGQLVDTPEQVEKNELLAWGGGLTDPSGQGKLGDAVINAGATQSKYRQKDKELRTQYIPLIMSALAQQAQAQALQAGSGESLSTMTPERALQLEQVNKGTWDAWKNVNYGENAAEGSFRQKWNPATGKLEWERYMPKAGGPTQDVTPQGDVTGVRNIPGTATASAQSAGAAAFGKGAGENLVSTTPVFSGGAKGVAPSSVVNPIDIQKGLQAFETQPRAGNPSPGGPVPPQGPPAGGGTTGPVGGPMPVIQPGPTPATPLAGAQQALRSRSGAPPVMDVLAGRATDSSQNAQMRGAWEGTPEQIEATMARFPPQIREQMRASYANQLTGKNPAKDMSFTPNYVAGNEKDVVPEAPVGTAPPATPAGGGVPGFIQQEASFGQAQQAKNIEQGNVQFMDTLKEMNKAAESFPEREVALNQMKGAFKAIGETGPGTSAFRKGVATLLSAAGVPESEDLLTHYQLAEQAIKMGVNKEIMADKGVATSSDERRHEAASNSLIGTPQYNAYILDMKRALLDRDKDKQAFFNEFYPKAKKTDNGDLMQVQELWQQNQPSIYNYPYMKKWREKYGN